MIRKVIVALVASMAILALSGTADAGWRPTYPRSGGSWW
jgi:hypothetical protein